VDVVATKTAKVVAASGRVPGKRQRGAVGRSVEERVREYVRDFDKETLAQMLVSFEDAIQKVKYKVFVRRRHPGSAK
jgi:hypothetical protein